MRKNNCLFVCVVFNGIEATSVVTLHTWKRVSTLTRATKQETQFTNHAIITQAKLGRTTTILTRTSKDGLSQFMKVTVPASNSYTAQTTRVDEIHHKKKEKRSNIIFLLYRSNLNDIHKMNVSSPFPTKIHVTPPLNSSHSWNEKLNAVDPFACYAQVDVARLTWCPCICSVTIYITHL